MRSHLYHLFNTLENEIEKWPIWYGGRSKRDFSTLINFLKNLGKNFPNFKILHGTFWANARR